MEEEHCNLSLCLGIGDGCASTISRGDHVGRKRSPVPFDIFFLTQSEDHEEKEPGYMPSSRKANHMEEEDAGVAKESSNGWEPRKKLRLTREQSEFLEESFEEHNTLNPMRKQELAERLGLRPRQVEIWFQNRRARTKLKQTEVNCELLRKYCESLRNENQRLKREVQELKSMNAWPSSACLQLSNNTLTPSICTSCRLCGDDNDDRSKNPGFNLVVDKLKLYSRGSKDSSLTC